MALSVRMESYLRIRNNLFSLVFTVFSFLLILQHA